MNTYYINGFPVSDELYHHGIIGQKWGVRRYQNDDGSLTTAGRARYGETKEIRKEARTQLSVERGNELLSKGRTKAGAIGRGIGREAAIIAGKAAIEVAIGAAIGMKAAELMDSGPSDSDQAIIALSKGAVRLQAMINAAAIGLTAVNAAKTVRQYKDISRAKKNKEAK